MNDRPLFLSNDAWLRLGDWLSSNEDVARQLGIMPNAFTGTISEVEITDFLGGQCNVWHEDALPVILAAAD